MTQAQARHNDLLQREQELQKEIDDQRALSTKTQEELARLREERERLEQELERAKSGASPSSAQTVVAFVLRTPNPRRGTNTHYHDPARNYSRISEVTTRSRRLFSLPSRVD